MMDKQNQKAGDNSQLVQAGVVNINVGVDEKRAREIFMERFEDTRKFLTQEAFEVANARVNEFENILMQKINTLDDIVNNAFSAFTDPSFQFLLTGAHKTAASTERYADYDLLSELLVHKMRNGKNRNIYSSVNRAIEIVDKISDDALLGLTVFYAITKFDPISGDINEGLNTLNNCFGEIIYNPLPPASSNEWIDNLDILDAIRVSSSTVKWLPIEDVYAQRLDGYVAVGIKQDSENYDKAIEILNSFSLPTDKFLVKHTLRDGYCRIPIVSKINLDRKETNKVCKQFQEENIELSESQIDALVNIFTLYDSNSDLMKNNISLFMEEWNKLPNLVIIKNWWNSMSTVFRITSVGESLAIAHCKRFNFNIVNINK